MERKSLLWRSLTLALGLALCFLAGVGTEGAIFLLAAFFVTFPRFAVCRWYELVLGALSSGVAELLAGEGSVLFWGLMAVAALSLSLTSMWKTIFLTALAGFFLWIGAGAQIYVSAFTGVIWNAILVFTYDKIYDKIET